MFVSQRMTRNPITVRPDTTVSDAQNLMRKEKVHRFPVLDRDQKLKGIVTEKDLLYASPSPASTLNVYEMAYLLSKLKVEEVMTGPVITITEDTPIEDAARIMADNNIGGLPVLRDGKLVGIITESDVFKVMLEMFGSRQRGVRITILVPEKKGELASIAAVIAEKGGNIISLGTFLGEDSTQSIITIKVNEISPEALEAAIKPFVTKIVDLRTV